MVVQLATLIAIVLAALSNTAVAQVRTWADRAGNTVEGTLVRVEDDQVILRISGKEKSYSFLGFSDRDRQAIINNTKLKPKQRQELKKILERSKREEDAKASSDDNGKSGKSAVPRRPRPDEQPFQGAANVPQAVLPAQHDQRRVGDQPRHFGVKLSPDPATAVRQIAEIESSRQKQPKLQAGPTQVELDQQLQATEKQKQDLRRQIVAAVNENRTADALDLFAKYELIYKQMYGMQQFQTNGRPASFPPAPAGLADVLPPLATVKDVGLLVEEIGKLRQESFRQSFAGLQLEALEQLLKAREYELQVFGLAGDNQTSGAAVYSRVGQLELQGKHDDAMRYFMAHLRALELKRGGRVPGNLLLASQLLRIPTAQQAVAVNEKLPKMDPYYDFLEKDVKQRLNAAAQDVAARKFREAASKARAVLDRLSGEYPGETFPDGHPGIAYTRLVLAACAFEQGDPNEARQQVAEATKFYGSMKPLYLLESAYLAALNGKLAGTQPAPAPIRAAPGRPTSTAGQVFAPAFELITKGQTEQAKRQAEQELAQIRKDHGPDDLRTIDAMADVGMVYWVINERVAAREFLEKAIKDYKRLGLQDERRRSLELMLASAGIAGGIDPTAKADALAKSGDALGELTAEAIRLAKQGNYAAAQGRREKAWLLYALRHGDPLVPIHLDLARSTADTGNYSRAVDYYQRLLRKADHKTIEMGADWSANLGRGELLSSYQLVAHTELAWNWTRLAKMPEALASLTSAVEFQQRQVVSKYANASDGQLLHLIDLQNDFRDTAISIGQFFEREPAEIYGWLWPTRGAVFNTIVERHAQWAREEDPQFVALREAYLKIRQQLTPLLLVSGDQAKELAKEINSVRRVELERKLKLKDQIEVLLIEWSASKKPSSSAGVSSVDDLVRELPSGTTVVDFVRFTRFEQDAKVPGKAGEHRTARYVAFIFSRGESVRSVDLGSADKIDAAIGAWRVAIDRGNDARAAQEVRDLVWTPVEARLAAATSRVLIVPESKLQLIPWSALPGKASGTILLEQYRLALVPGVRSLVEHNRSSRKAGIPSPGRLLVAGNIDYDGLPAQQKKAAAGNGVPPMGNWQPLAGTAREVRALRELFEDQKSLQELTRTDATTQRIVEQLPQARWAVLATHGFFARPNSQLVDSLVERSGMSESIARQNPLLFTSLVLAGANLARPVDASGAPQGDGGLLSAEGVAELPLGDLELAVLSACESGLGQATEGEGLAGLQRAFHLAGTRRVVGTLWQVDDEATVAVMRLFYGKLWRAKKDPETALREAQLSVYRHPESVKSLAELRGLNFLGDLKKIDERTPTARDRYTRTRLWAPFMISTAVVSNDADDH